MDDGSPPRCAMPSPNNPNLEITLQFDVELDGTVTADAVTSLVRHVLQAEGWTADWQMGIRFVDDPTMQAAHVEFMDIDEPTDIMTFPYEDEVDFDLEMFGDESGEISGGDLIISADRAAENASAANWGTAQELYFLIIHGVLHLLGWDDASDDDRRVMLERQAHLLSEWRESPGARS